jgi:hypothetical protein
MKMTGGKPSCVHGHDTTKEGSRKKSNNRCLICEKDYDNKRNAKSSTWYRKYKWHLLKKIERKKAKIAELERILLDEEEVSNRNGTA